VLATRVGKTAAARVVAQFPAAVHDKLSRTVSLRQKPVACEPEGGFIAVVCAGTADLPVAEEARITAELMDQRVQTLYDVGVAGIHRLLAKTVWLRQANVVVVIAGMEGALPSVVGGLVEAPVIAVPTSVGYGASLGGIAALLSMLNSCASGLSVVNIDNGFGAGYQAALINRLATRWIREHGSGNREANDGDTKSQPRAKKRARVLSSARRAN
ncbi:MAG: nickel pincer cofactor biosynthesis protein LarB, partial [Deltaproteobacteria bacterium]|nr:nickel pincer cofactor biosynthesis protein LarB [Deltaproteobacteria bacterium]